MTGVRVIPQVMIEADGVPLGPDGVGTLTHLRVQQRLSLPTLCELTFSDPPGPLPSPATLAPGAEIRIAIGTEEQQIFVGQLTASEHVYTSAHHRQIRVRGYDLLHRLRKRQNVRAHVEVTLRDLVEDLTSELGVSIEVEESGPLWRFLLQHRQSDLELLTEVAERCGVYLALRGDVLHLLTLDGIGDPVSLRLGDSLLEATVDVNGDPACRSVTAFGWDPQLVEVHQGEASVPRVGREVLVEVAPEDVGGTGTRELLDESASDDAHATALAQAELDVRIAREVTLWGVADGDARLGPGTPVDIEGIADELSGRYVVTETTHTFDEQMGFLTEFSTVPPAPRPRSNAATVAFGMVTRVDDPENLGRVRLSLPSISDLETDWVGVLTAGAGSGKGIVALPDVGDRVLVLFPHEDPSRGVVLGGVYGATEPPDAGVHEGAIRRYTLITPGGQKIQLDDTRNQIRVENSDDSYIELSPEKVLLHSNVDLDIEAPGKAITVRGKSVDFVSG
jgi:uncharacterized protein involved in type VI secretion and phage assembly